MNKYAKRTGATLLATLVLASLSACGGGGSNNDSTTTTAAAPAAEAPVIPEAPQDKRLAVNAITIFGDSLSDVGTYAVATGDAGNPGKFTVNPGKVWVENIAAHFGLTITPNRSLTMDKDASYGATTEVGTARVLGGNGYAEGGARIAALPSQSGVGNNRLVAPIAKQIDNYLGAKEHFGAGELVVIDGGGNDTYAQFSSVCWGTDENELGSGNTTIAIATAQIEAAAQTQVNNVKRLLANNAPLVLVASASDWSSTPFGKHYLSATYQTTNCYVPVPASQIGAWTTRFNEILSAGLQGLAGVQYFDTDSAFAAALAEPEKFGLVNTTSARVHNTTPTNSATFCTAATLAAPDAAQTYLWSDSFHPSPRGHEIVSDRVIALLDVQARAASAEVTALPAQ